MQEDYWKIRSRINWLNEGDSNSKKFHIRATNNRIRNKIIYFIDPEGNWIDDPQKIMDHTLSYFKENFSTSHSHSNWSSIKSDTPSHHQIDLSSLDTNISPIEIKNVIFSFNLINHQGQMVYTLFSFKSIGNLSNLQ